jgi:hypothetical protein
MRGDESRQNPSQMESLLTLMNADSERNLSPAPQFKTASPESYVHEAGGAKVAWRDKDGLGGADRGRKTLEATDGTTPQARMALRMNSSLNAVHVSQRPRRTASPMNQAQH